MFITTLDFHKNLENSAQITAWPFGLGIPDFNRPGFYRFSDRYVQEQKHADAFRVVDGISKILTWPTTFDGSLPSVTLGGQRSPIQIGKTYSFAGAGPNGEDLVGTVTSAMMLEAEKCVVLGVHCNDDKGHILKEKVSDAQIADYRAYPDAYFGEVVRPQRESRTPQDMFEFLMHAYAGLDREKLLKYLKGRVDGIETMETDHLRAIYCEGLLSSLGIFEVVDGVMTSRPQRKSDVTGNL